LLPTIGEKARARLQKDVRQAQQHITELNERINANQNQAFRCQEQVKELKDQMSWNEQELDTWMVGIAVSCV
jgi:peptidoglycan hydrolase CwlO-like protein